MERLARIHALLGEGYAAPALALAREGKAEAVDPLRVGLYRFYEFKALYQLQAWQEAYDLFRRPEPRPYALSTKNEAWMHSVAAECAGRLGHAEDVVRWARRCYALRRSDGDPVGAAQCLNTACLLLAGLGRPDLNTEFADRMIELGLELGAENAVIQGVLRLLENYEAAARATVRRRLQKGTSLLPALRNPDFRRRAEEALEKVKRLFP